MVFCFFNCVYCEFFAISSQCYYGFTEFMHKNLKILQCSHFEGCSGCSEYLSLKPPPIWEEVLSFFYPYATPSFHALWPLHWRHRAKVAVRGSVGNPQIGLFKCFSHEVFSIPHCLVHHPSLNRAFSCVEKWMKDNRIVPYEESAGKGELRYLQGVVQRKSGKVQLSLVFNSSSKNKEQTNRICSLVKLLNKQEPSLWHSLWINFHAQQSNIIFGSEWFLVEGEELLWEEFDGLSVCYGPTSFGQANLPLFEQMLFRIRELLPNQSRVAEFYAGVGVIGLFISSHCEWVRCSEINPFAEFYFQYAKSKLPKDVATHISFATSSAEKALSLMEGATAVIVDPPRKGCDLQFLEALNHVSSVNQLLYISCGWQGFKRDFQRLQKDGWSVVSVDGYHFFPGTNHVELLVNFERKKNLGDRI